MNVARAFDVLQRYTTAAADSREELPPYGFVVRSPSLPSARGINHVAVTAPLPDLDAETLIDVVVSALPDVPEPQVVVEDQATGERVEPGMLAAGWEVERAVLMTLADAPRAAPAADTSAVREGTEDEILALMERWFDEEEGEKGPDVVAELVEYARRETRALPERRFLFDLGDGPVAMCQLRRVDEVAYVEDVFVAPEARGRGAGTALVTRALAEARMTDPELTIIFADADDRPRELYARLGFEAQTTYRSFWRPR